MRRFRSFSIATPVILLASLLQSAASHSQTNPVEVTFPSGNLVLHGFIYKPEGKGPFPAVLWNHGSERRPGWLPELAPFFSVRATSFSFLIAAATDGPQANTSWTFSIARINREAPKRAAESLLN
jgi:hypothetical protein